VNRALTALALLASASASAVEVVEISAPIFPKVLVLYTGEGSNYPASQAAREQLAADSALTYSTLLTTCEGMPQYSAITLQAPAAPALTPSQLSTNYQLVAQCSYEQYTAKPYWIPQLVSDVNICESQLGPDWHLLAESDLATFTQADYQFFQDTLTEASSANNNTTFWGSFYFGLRVFLRAADGTIQAGDLAPGVVQRVSALNYPAGLGAQHHYEGGLALRCIRRTQVP
jgi:hypothetical protein